MALNLTFIHQFGRLDLSMVVVLSIITQGPKEDLSMPELMLGIGLLTFILLSSGFKRFWP